MNSKRFLVAAVMAMVGGVGVAPLALAGGAGAVTAALGSEADFAAPAQQRPTPARAGAVQALHDLALRTQAQAGTLPQGFPFAVQDVADLAQAKIGYGFQVYDADPLRLTSGESLERSAQPTGVWRFAVMLGNKPVGLLTMAQTAEGWSAVSMGGAGLAKEVDAVVYAHGGKAAQLHYVRVPQATADFIEVKGAGGATGFLPLQAARESLRLANGGDGLLGDRELQPSLRDAVSRNLAH